MSVLAYHWHSSLSMNGAVMTTGLSLDSAGIILYIIFADKKYQTSLSDA